MNLARTVVGAAQGCQAWLHIRRRRFCGRGTMAEASPAWCLRACLKSLGIGVEMFPMMGIYNTSAGSPSTIMGHQVDSLGWGFVTQRMLMQFSAMNSQMKLFSSQELTQEKTQFFFFLPTPSCGGFLPRPHLTKARHFPAPHSHLMQTWSLVPCATCLLLLNV